MALTAEQLVTFGNDIRANTDPTVVAALAAGDHNTIANWYNQEATPLVWVFKSFLTVAEAIAVMDWPNEYATEFKDDLEGFNTLFTSGQISGQQRAYDPRSPGAREALNTVMAGADNSKTGILTESTRNANYFEAIFVETTSGPGGGDGSNQNNNAIAVVEGNTTSVEVRDALIVTEP